MSAKLIKGAKFGKHQYFRKFDHDEAKRRNAAGESAASLAREYGVSTTAVLAVVSQRIRASMDRAKERIRQSGRCERCGGPKNGLSSYSHGANLCRSCAFDDLATSVRDTELRCSKCREWKPDEDFPRNRSESIRRRGRHDQCRACNTIARRAHRRRNREADNTYQREYNRRRREQAALASTPTTSSAPHGSFGAWPKSGADRTSSRACS